MMNVPVANMKVIGRGFLFALPTLLLSVVLVLCLSGCSSTSSVSLDKSTTFHGLTYSISSNWAEDEPWGYEYDDGSEAWVIEYLSSDHTLKASVYCYNDNLNETIEEANDDMLDGLEWVYSEASGYTLSNLSNSKVRDIEISGAEGAIYKTTYTLSSGQDKGTCEQYSAYLMGSQMHYEVDVLVSDSSSDASSTLDAMLENASVKA